jgi:hypothetical protein
MMGLLTSVNGSLVVFAYCNNHDQSSDGVLRINTPRLVEE